MNMIVKGIANETLHPNDSIQPCKNGKVKRSRNTKKTIGFVAPILNPTSIKKNENVFLIIYALEVHPNCRCSLIHSHFL